MRKFTLVIFMLILSTHLLTHAGDGHEGGGGDAVICYADNVVGRQYANELNAILKQNHEYSFHQEDRLFKSIFSIQSYDLWIHKKKVSKNGRPQGLYNTAAKSEFDIIEALFSRSLSKTNISNELRPAAEDLIWIGFSGIEERDDSGRAGLPEPNCVIVQMAFQANNEVAFNHLLYNSEKMAPLDRAALRVHEYAKALALKNQRDDTSFFIHSAVGLMFADAATFNQINPLEYSMLWGQAIGLKETGTSLNLFIDGQDIELFSVRQKGYRGQVYYEAYPVPTGRQFIITGAHTQAIRMPSEFSLTPDGRLISLVLSETTVMPTYGYKHLIELDPKNSIRLQDGWLMRGSPAKNTVLEVRGTNYCFIGENQIDFNADGSIKTGLVFAKKPANPYGVDFSSDGSVQVSDRSIAIWGPPTSQSFKEALSVCK